MDKLNYDILKALRPDVHLEVIDVDVKRLRDDRTDIQLGQEVAFVATFALRVTHDGRNVIWKEHSRRSGHGPPGTSPDCWQQLAAEDKLLEIGTDAEVRSDKIPIDEEDLISWLEQHYTFTFLLDGVADEDHKVFHDVGVIHVRTGDSSSPDRELALPWVKKLGIGDFQAEYIDVSVRIEAAKPAPNEDSKAVLNYPDMSHQVFGLTLEAKIEASPTVPLSTLTGRPFQIVDHDTGAQISFVLKLTNPAEGKTHSTKEPILVSKSLPTA